MTRLARRAPRLALSIALTTALAGLSVLIAAPTPASAQEGDDADVDIDAAVKALVAQLDAELEHLRIEAIAQLGELGTDAERAIPHVLRRLRRGTLGEQIVAAESAPFMDPASSEVFAVLSGFLSNPESHYELRAAAAAGLAFMGVESDVLTPRIVETLARELAAQRHGNLVDEALAKGLGALGPRAADRAADIETALAATPFKEVKMRAFIALSEVVPADPSADAATLIGKLESPRAGTRARAYGQLAGLGRKAAAAIEPLLAISARPDAEIYDRVVALRTATRIAPAHERVLDACIAALEGEDPLLRGTAAAGFDLLERKHARAAGARLIELLKTARTHRAQIAALDTLRRLAPTSPTLIAAEIEALKSATGATDQMFIHELIETLRAAGPAAKDAAPVIASLLAPAPAILEGRGETDRDYLRGHALVAIAELGIPDDAADEVLASLEGAHPRVVLCASLRAIGALGAKGAVAVPELIEIVKGSAPGLPSMLPFLHDSFPRLEAIRALGRIGPAARAAIPALRKLANLSERGGSRIRTLETQAARRALEKIQG